MVNWLSPKAQHKQTFILVFSELCPNKMKRLDVLVLSEGLVNLSTLSHLSDISPSWSLMLSQGEKYRTYVISMMNRSVCSYSQTLHYDRNLTIMSFVFPASCVGDMKRDVRWRVEAYELWHADFNNDGKKGRLKRARQQKNNNLYSACCCCLTFVSVCNILYAASDSGVLSICFLRIKVVFLLSRGCIWVDKVSNPARRTGI